MLVKKRLNNPSFHFNLEKENQKKHKVRRMKETIKITTVEKNRKKQYNRVSHQKQKFLQFFPSLSIFRNKLNKKWAKHIR